MAAGHAPGLQRLPGFGGGGPGAHGRFETVRRELREWTCDDVDRICSWGPATEVDAAACFPDLLRWVRALWTPCEEDGEGEAGTEPPLVLALDPTHQRDEWVALVVSVVYRSHAILVAWHVVEAQARESWLAHFEHLLRQLAPAVPDGTPVHVLCDRGLDSRDLWRPIVELGWHPVLRYQPHITFRSTGGERVPVRSLGGGPGTLWVGAGEAFAREPLPATLVVLHAPKQQDPWVLLTDTPPTETDADLYACRHWIEQGFRGPGGAAGSGDARAAGTPCAWPGTCWPWPWPRCWRSPAEADPDSLLPRRFSLLRQGAACLRRLLVRHRLWARVWLTPLPGPDRVGDLHCLSPPAA